MTPKAIVNAIEARLGVTGVPRQVRDAIETELLAAGFGLAAAAEQIDQLKSKVVSEIARRHSELDERGEIAILHVRGIGNEIVSGSSFVFGDDTDQIRQAKQNRIS